MSVEKQDGAQRDSQDYLQLHLLESQLEEMFAQLCTTFKLGFCSPISSEELKLQSDILMLVVKYEDQRRSNSLMPFEVIRTLWYSMYGWLRSLESSRKHSKTDEVGKLLREQLKELQKLLGPPQETPKQFSGQES